jgi:hypothetical protein
MTPQELAAAFREVDEVLERAHIFEIALDCDVARATLRRIAESWPGCYDTATDASWDYSARRAILEALK